MKIITRKDYAGMFGPTTGDRVRLGDTNLIIEVEKDYTHYGDELKFGGGKSFRDGMGQSSVQLDVESPDTIITNALIVDYTGIYKADIGIKDGKISAIGKAGSPQTMSGITPGLEAGSGTEALAGEGLIVTAGGLDTHIHFISPQQIRTAPSTPTTPKALEAATLRTSFVPLASQTCCRVPRTRPCRSRATPSMSIST